MARKRKSAGPGDNAKLSPNDYLGWRRAFNRATILHYETGLALKAIRKKARAIKVPLDAVKLLDDARTKARVETANKLHEWEHGVALFTQADLFAPLNDRPTDKALAEYTEEQAENEGYLGGCSGQPRENNIHPVGNVLHARYDVGWLRGQAKIASEMEEGDGAAKPADQTRERREPPLAVSSNGNGHSNVDPPWPTLPG